MTDLPEPASRILIRAISAYMKATPVTQLPGPLRPLRNFNLRALAPQRHKLFDVFEDDAFAARVVEWLDKWALKSLSPKEAELLGLFARRPEGWERALADAARDLKPVRRKSSSSPRDHERLLERQRERARKAEDRERRARVSARAAAREGRAKVEALERQVEALDDQLCEARRDSAQLRKELQGALNRCEQEQRKRLKAADKAQIEREKLRGELRASRRESRELRTRVARLEAARVEKSSRSGASRKSSQPRARRPLPVPPGRPGDDAESLSEWLTAPGVHLLVDGYNVTKAEGGFGGLDLEAQRERLIVQTSGLALRKGIRATIVFDGAAIPRATFGKKSPVAIEYSEPPENADDRLIARLAALGPKPVVVVTNDRELQDRASELGATIATSNQLLELLR